MKKLLLTLMLGVMLLGTFSVVSAAPGFYGDYEPHEGVTFTSPSDWATYMAGGYLLQWTNEGSYPNIVLQMREDACYPNFPNGDWDDLETFPNDLREYNLETSKYDDGEYCVRLKHGDDTYSFRTLIIDNEAPEVRIDEFIGLHYNPLEDDASNKVKVEYEHSDNEYVDSCLISWGDGHTWDCDTSTGIHFRQHQYADNGEYPVTITVYDEAGNSASDSVVVDVANVNPWEVSAIDSPDQDDLDSNDLDEAAVGEAVRFTAEATDVVADADSLKYYWSFDGEESVLGGEEMYHTWDQASVHTIDLTVMDKDGGEYSFAQYEIEIFEPEAMTPEQKAVVEQVFKFELDEPWNVDGGLNKKFKTDIGTLDACEDVLGNIPGMTVEVVPGTNKCKVLWPPTDDQMGEHLVIVKAKSGSTFKYYSFTVDVYSWGIEMCAGWNLISIPFVPVDSSIDTVFADILPYVAYEGTGVATVFQYDSVSNDWYRARPTSTHSSFTYQTGNSARELETIVPGYGYWVKMDGSILNGECATLYGVEENFYPAQGPVPSVEIASDAWSLIGTYGNEAVDSNTALETLDGNWYSNGLLTWDGVSSWSVLGGDMQPTEGYWLRTKMPDSGQSSMTYDPLGYYFL